MQKRPRRVIFDSNIWVSFAIGKRLEEMRTVLAHPGVEVLVCPRLLQEVGTVTQRPKLRKYVSPQRREMLLDLMQVCHCVEIDEQASMSRDPGDDYLLDLAVTVGADFIVTGDKDLLVLEKFQNTSIVPFAVFMALGWAGK